MSKFSLAAALCLALLTGTPSSAQTPDAAPSTTDAEAATQAQKLLQRAVRAYQQNGDQALAAFSRSGEFIRGAHYVYVLNLKGHMLASGGSSSALIGRDVSDMVDATGKPFFRDMINGAQQSGSGQIAYRWLNRVDNKVEKKITFYQRVDDKILAVGFYAPHASPAQAKALLDEAAGAIQADPEKAFAAFNNLSGRFIQDDLYVFVVDLGDTRFRAHGADPRLVGTSGKTLRNPNGTLVIQEMTKQLKTKEQGELVYDWNNPVTHRVETKHTLLRKVGGYLVGVGYYTR
ncbi:MAG: cache domain-containing protein [Burkholderiales bacterium]|nr:cache domain-containing protein [Burkholderiales bacterium]